MGRVLSSYWQGPGDYLSLLEDFGERREVHLIWLEKSSGSKFSFLACDNLEAGRRWIKQSKLGRPTGVTKALFLPGILPKQPPLPVTNENLYDLVSALSPDRKRVWERFVKSQRSSTVVLSTVTSSRGETLVGWMHPRKPDPSLRNTKEALGGGMRGFRAGHEPIGFEMKGWSAKELLGKYDGERIDTSRLYSRTQGEEPRGVFKHLLVVGVGSLGSHLLTQAIGAHCFDRVSLIDSDVLKVENVLRHAADFSHIGKNKALAMSEAIGARCPWLSIDVSQVSALDAQAQLDDWTQAADVILLATGDASLEEYLAAYMLEKAHGGATIHRAWITAGAVSGHLVRYIAGMPGCPRCIQLGTTLSGADIRYEPGCTAGFARYGGSRLQRYVLAADDALLSAPEKPWIMNWHAREGAFPATDGCELIDLDQGGPCDTCGR